MPVLVYSLCMCSISWRLDGQASVTLTIPRKEDMDKETKGNPLYKFESSYGVRRLVVKGWESTKIQ